MRSESVHRRCRAADDATIASVQYYRVYKWWKHNKGSPAASEKPINLRRSVAAVPSESQAAAGLRPCEIEFVTQCFVFNLPKYKFKDIIVRMSCNDPLAESIIFS